MTDSILVLLVDDEVLIGDLIEEALTDGGFHVETASSGEDAMAVIEARAADLKALVTDVNLGSKVTGWDLGKRARELNPDIPVVYMSGFAESEWTANGVPKSIMIAKPLAPSQVLTAVAQLLNAGGS